MPLALTGLPQADPIPLSCGIVLDLMENCSFLTGLLPGMPAFLAGWKEAIKDSELPYREATASIGNL
ncbi:MAG: hypothetical protein BBJ60_00845 [Desulfobacterales bacterium S7086C20]|nr:MAG: hypothetical protein BBJ60_00845 [Desulfobacterales bacterium S7086C20]